MANPMVKNDNYLMLALDASRVVKLEYNERMRIKNAQTNEPENE